MTTNYIETIQEVFGDLTKLTPGKMQDLIDSTMRYFYELEEQLASKDEKVCEQAMIQATVVKDTLQKQMNDICQKIGLDPAQLAAFVAKPTLVVPRPKKKKNKKINLVA